MLAVLAYSQPCLQKEKKSDTIKKKKYSFVCANYILATIILYYCILNTCITQHCFQNIKELTDIAKTKVTVTANC